jgi:hypothetical protein
MVMYLLISEKNSSSYHLLWVFIISVQGHLNLKNIFVKSISNFHNMWLQFDPRHFSYALKYLSFGN